MLWMFFLPVLCFAGIIDGYESMLDFFHRILADICFLSGGALLVSSLAQFKMHRDNPSEVKLKVPMTLLILGGILLALSYLPMP